MIQKLRLNWLPYPEKLPPAPFGTYTVTLLRRDGKERLVREAYWENNDLHKQYWFGFHHSDYQVIAWADRYEIEPFNENSLKIDITNQLPSGSRFLEEGWI